MCIGTLFAYGWLVLSLLVVCWWFLYIIYIYIYMAILGGYFLKSMKNIVNNTNKIQYYSIDFSFRFRNPGYFRIETSLHLVGLFHAVDSATTRRSLHGSTRMPWATRWEHGPLKDSYISYEGVRIVSCHVRLPEYIYYVIMSYIYIYRHTHTCHICHIYIWVIPTSAQQKTPKRYTSENYPWTYENRAPGFPEIPPETPSLRYPSGESRFVNTPGIRFAGWIYEKSTHPRKTIINNGTSPS